MSDYHRLDREALDRHITGNYGEDQFPGIECGECGGAGRLDDKPDSLDCPRCHGEGWLDAQEELEMVEPPDTAEQAEIADARGTRRARGY
jgi:DnaJ-class molecular chaperone